MTELDEYVTIRQLFLRACSHAWFRCFSIFDAAFLCLFDSLRHSSKTSLFMFVLELLLGLRERIGAPTCRATIERHNQLHRGEKN